MSVADAIPLCHAFLDDPYDQTPLLLMADALEEAGDPRGPWCRWVHEVNTTVMSKGSWISRTTQGRIDAAISLARCAPLSVQRVALAAATRLVTATPGATVMQLLRSQAKLVAAAEMVACGLANPVSKGEVGRLFGHSTSWEHWVACWMIFNDANMPYVNHTSLVNYGWAQDCQLERRSYGSYQRKRASYQRKRASHEAAAIACLVLRSEFPKVQPVGEPLFEVFPEHTSKKLALK